MQKRKKTEWGRSMIEMLGVLAIIGVLSAGGIAGYSSAMTSYKTNKTLDAISYFSAQTAIIFKNSPTAITYRFDTICSLHALPEDICNATNNEWGKSYRTGYFGEKVLMSSETRPTGNSSSNLTADGDYVFVMPPLIVMNWNIYTKIPLAACVKLVTNPMWYDIGIFARAYQLGGENYELPMEVSTATTQCKIADESDSYYWGLNVYSAGTVVLEE